MPELTLRSMTAEESEAYRREGVAGYAEANRRSGRWSAEEAERLSEAAYEQLFPDGVATDGVLTRVGVAGDGQVVGRVVVGLTSPSRPDEAWIYDIQVVPEQRGRGYGRALLEAGVGEVVARGMPAVGLNVFGDNVVARELYESAGSAPMAIQMRRQLG